MAPAAQLDPGTNVHFDDHLARNGDAEASGKGVENGEQAGGFIAVERHATVLAFAQPQAAREEGQQSAMALH